MNPKRSQALRDSIPTLKREANDPDPSEDPWVRHYRRYCLLLIELVEDLDATIKESNNE